jgi:hypothetical protein
MSKMESIIMPCDVAWRAGSTAQIGAVRAIATAWEPRELNKGAADPHASLAARFLGCAGSITMISRLAEASL